VPDIHITENSPLKNGTTEEGDEGESDREVNRRGENRGRGGAREE
jgi:hypothetical protein